MTVLRVPSRTSLLAVGAASIVACSDASPGDARFDADGAPTTPPPRTSPGQEDTLDGGGMLPIPTIDPEPAPPCAAASPSNDHYQFLDDVCKAKRLPSDRARDFACPVIATATDVVPPNGKSVHYRSSAEPVVFDDDLEGVVPASVAVTAILIKRVGGVPRYRYISNGTQEQAFQPWSSTKFMAAANAAASLRTKSALAVGLTARVANVELGDLVTAMVSYDETHGYSSNSIGRYFHDIGGRARANDLVHGAWLQRPAAETFGGNYGEPSPGLAYTFVEDGGTTVTVTPDGSSGPANRLSTQTIAEFLKRLALHREEPSQRLPGIQQADIETLFYGASNSAWFPGAMGGMSADTAIYVQAGHDIGYLDARSKGRWRIFSKLGFGNGEFVHAAYACLPALDASGAPIPDGGKELVIVTRATSGASTELERDRSLARTYRTLLPAVIDGRIP